MTRLPGTAAQRVASTLWLFGLLALGRCNDAHGPPGTTPGDSSVDCCRDTPDTPVCNYQPALGHWACEAATFCNG